MPASATLSDGLLAELMEALRLQANGDALAAFGLAGKQSLSAFESAIGNLVGAQLDIDNMHLRNLDTNIRFLYEEDVIACAYRANFCFIARFVNKLKITLHSSLDLAKDLIPENITKLTLVGLNTVALIGPLMKKFPNLEVLNLLNSAFSMFHEVETCGLRFDNLTRLELRLTPDELRQMVYMIPKIVLPPQVAVRVTDGDLVDFTDPLPFPNVEEFGLTINFDGKLKLDLLQNVTKVFHCFPNATSLKLNILTYHDPWSTDIKHIEEVHSWLNRVKFSTSVEFAYEAMINFNCLELGDFDDLETLGFAEANGGITLINTRKFPSVELTHSFWHDSKVIDVKLPIKDSSSEDNESVEEEASSSSSSNSSSENDTYTISDADSVCDRYFFEDEF